MKATFWEERQQSAPLPRRKKEYPLLLLLIHIAERTLSQAPSLIKEFFDFGKPKSLYVFWFHSPWGSLKTGITVPGQENERTRSMERESQAAAWDESGTRLAWVSENSPSGQRWDSERSVCERLCRWSKQVGAGN